MRAPSATDFLVPVEGLGDFMFAKRQMSDEARIQAEYRRITEGLESPGPWLNLVGTWLSTIKVLLVSAPDPKWGAPDGLDPLDEDTYSELARVYTALSEKERSFRRKPIQGGAATGQADGHVGRLLVPPKVQPSSD